jgi:hypothetical protein
MSKDSNFQGYCIVPTGITQRRFEGTYCPQGQAVIILGLPGHELRALHSLKTSVTIRRAIQVIITKCLNPYHHLCESSNLLDKCPFFFI